MFILTARISRRRLIAGAAALVLLCGAAAAVNTLTAERTVGAAASSPASPKGVKTNEDRVELLIPEEFDQTYEDYLALQESQGFDLTQYRGERVKRYTYEILNYPTGEAGVQADLLLYRNTVIGGDVLSAEIDGFIQGLAMPESTGLTQGE